MKYLKPLIVIFSCLLLSLQVSAKVYKWTDDKGQVHYSEQPSAEQNSEVIKLKTGHSDPVNYSTSSSSTANTGNNTVEGPEYVKDPELCAAARKNQSVLQTSTRVQVKDDNGQYRYLTPDELKQKMDEAVKVIERSCD